MIEVGLFVARKMVVCKVTDEMSVVKLFASIPILASLTFATPQAVAGDGKTSDCPEPTEHVREALENLAQRLARHVRKGPSAPPVAAIQSVEDGEVRRLTPGRDETACRALFEQGHSEYLDKTWNQELEIEGEIYPYYDAGYYKVGDYYFALFVKTPTPQDDDPTMIRIVTGYSTALIYNENFEKLVGYSF